MRILFLTPDAFGGHGGISKYCRDLLTALCSHPRVEEVVAIPRLAPKAIETLPPKLRYVTAGLNSKLKFAGATLGELVRMSNCQMVVCAHINLLPFAVIAAARFRAPLALLTYGIDVWQATERLMTDGLCKSVHHVVSISQTTLDRFVSWAEVDGAKKYVLPNAFDPQLLSPGPKSDALLKRYGLRDKRVLMTFGRMPGRDRHKGYDEVLELLPKLVRDVPDVAYLLAGDGPDRPRLERKAHELGVADRVVFAGEVREVEKADHYRLADVYVMPSRGEGFGFVLLEAMACGIPTIGSSEDGGREALRNGMLGDLVAPGDHTSLLAAIHRALARTERVVPKGLDYFAFRNFETRVHAFVDDVTKTNHRGLMATGDSNASRWL